MLVKESGSISKDQMPCDYGFVILVNSTLVIKEVHDIATHVEKS